jgi:predicted dehydrogenase
MIDLMIATSGRDVRRVASLQNRIEFPELKEMENVTASLFELDNGGIATLRLDYFRTPSAPTHGDDRLRIAGTKGVIEWTQATGLVLMTNEQPPEKQERLPQPGQVFIDFLEHVYLGRATALPVEEIYRGNEITIAAQLAADKGDWVSVNKA